MLVLKKFKRAIFQVVGVQENSFLYKLHIISCEWQLRRLCMLLPYFTGIIKQLQMKAVLITNLIKFQRVEVGSSS